MTYVDIELTEAAVLDAIGAANIAVGKCWHPSPYQEALAKARARLAAAVTLVESTGKPAPRPFDGLAPNSRPGDARARWVDSRRPDPWQRPRAADRAS